MGFRWVEHGCYLGWDSDGVCISTIWDGVQAGTQLGTTYLIVAGSWKVFPSRTLILLAAGAHGCHMGLNSGWDPAYRYHIP